jgi:predicted membrane-bound mannosyltransferase
MSLLLQSSADALALRPALSLLRTDFLVSLVIDLVCVAVLTRVIYYRHYRRSDLFLTFFSFNVVIFLIAYSLNRVEMTLGAAFGLFAVFSMLRFRTEDISTKDMTYMFLVIALGLLMATGTGGPLELAAIGVTILGSTALLEGNWLVRRELAQEVWYDRIELVGAEARPALIQDLRQRTGLEVHRVDVRQIDYLRDAARLTLYHYAP